MRQHEDNRTGDLLDGSIRQRGRPATGQAKTAAQRQAERRERLKKTEGKGQLTVDLPHDVLSGLRKFVQFKDITQDEVVERLLPQQLQRKR